MKKIIINQNLIFSENSDIDQTEISSFIDEHLSVLQHINDISTIDNIEILKTNYTPSRANYEHHIIFSRILRLIERNVISLHNYDLYKNVTPHVSNKLEIGSILFSTWGYDQTNVDFFVVVKMTAKQCTILGMKSKNVKNIGPMTNNVIPDSIDYSQSPITKKINNGNYVMKISSYSYLALWDGVEQCESHYA